MTTESATDTRRPLAIRIAVASLIANVVIVLTGSLVRLTGSGLGCPTWPQCTDDSFVATAEQGVHGVIENGNRLLGVLVGLIAIAAVIAVVRMTGWRSVPFALSVAILVAVGVQGVVGGLSVRMDLAPGIVAAHFLISMGIVAAATVLIELLRARPGPGVTVPRGLRWSIVSLAPALALVHGFGAVVTGAGPHGGDNKAERFDLDPLLMTIVHGLAVVLFLGLQLVILVGFRMAAINGKPAHSATLLLGLSLTQGVLGYVQYLLAIPAILVAIHVVGAALITWATTLTIVHSLAWRSSSVDTR
ncbi:heme A synthase [Kibdelosporangium persicum]|uniref:Cytochrome oxidase assembly n=1 Tax=Kibdelosporangium persicum TaxID=2698649 RepID=A0ABX2FIE6_9PSEU|nr:COX15/CtaA family protein [Kibdelosporangium persicum]NRN70889.1 Cytochrome oxidase assembly [Kibdelosporangium persicum]